MQPRKHDCLEHIVRRIPPKGSTFTSGGVPEHRCGVCNKSVALRFRPNEVLARVPA
jgi:hypothetical protein